MPPGGAVPSEKWGDWPITSMEEVLCLSHLIEQSMPDVLLQLYKMKLRHPKVNMNCDDHADPNCKLYSANSLQALKPNHNKKQQPCCERCSLAGVIIYKHNSTSAACWSIHLVHHTHKNQMESQLLRKTNPNLPPSPRSA